MNTLDKTNDDIVFSRPHYFSISEELEDQAVGFENRICFTITEPI